LPAVTSYGAGKKLFFVLEFVTDPANPLSRPVLSALFPIERHRRYTPLPVNVFSLWRHPHCYLCTPLLKAEYARLSLSTFVDWLISYRSCGVAKLEYIPGEGPFRALLNECLHERGISWLLSDSFARAFLRIESNVDEYFQHTISGKGRRELKRKTLRLSEMGRLQYEELVSGGDPAPWIEEFLRLESMGWKGAQNTALACNEPDRYFFRLIAREAFEKGKLLIGALRLNDKIIAIQCGFLSGMGYFAFKSAFDENYARFSPGVLLLMEIIGSAHQKEGLLWMDSCTTPENFIANRLFAEKRGIGTVFIATRRSGAVLVSLMRLNRRIRERSRPEPVDQPELAVTLQNEVRV